LSKRIFIVPAEYGTPVAGLMGTGTFFFRFLRTALEEADIGSFDNSIPPLPKKKELRKDIWISPIDASSAAGTDENSPAFQRRESVVEKGSPASAGRLKAQAEARVFVSAG
jgi:hypothetical protein